MKIEYTIVVVSDMDRAVAFYRDVVGIPLKFQSPGWSEFVTEGSTLALHAATAGGPSAAPRQEVAGTVRPGFRVDDLDAFHARMARHGTPCVSEPAMQFGARLAQYEGFDGLVFTVSGGNE